MTPEEFYYFKLKLRALHHKILELKNKQKAQSKKKRITSEEFSE
jgi:hypothetical protein